MPRYQHHTRELNVFAAAVQTEPRRARQVSPRARRNPLVEAAFENYQRSAAIREGSGEVYAEGIFRYLLVLEKKRSEAADHPLLLMLIELGSIAIDQSSRSAVAPRVFSALARCLRETDFIGWFRAPRVIGAVLTQHRQATGGECCERVQERVVGEFERRFPAEVVRALEVRVHQVVPNSRRHGERCRPDSNAR